MYERFKSREGGILGDEPGLGKTIQVSPTSSLTRTLCLHLTLIDIAQSGEASVDRAIIIVRAAGLIHINVGLTDVCCR